MSIERTEQSLGLSQRVARAIAHAQQRGARIELATRSALVYDSELTFVVHLAEPLRQKASHAQSKDTPANPFLPYDPDLWVADLAPRHVCLLNKYYIVAQHVLIVTREFEPQEAPLQAEDFQAWWAVLSECGGLGFYNGGLLAGASQPHKHMQHIPWPAVHIPTGKLLVTVYEQRAEPGKVIQIRELPFRHALAAWAANEPSQAPDWPRCLERWYQRLLGELAVDSVGSDGQRCLGPYNLLLTNRWMLLVPRQRDGLYGISLNAMAYAGSILVPDETAFEALRREGPLALLAAAAA